MATVRSLSFAGKAVNVPVPNTFGAQGQVVNFSAEGFAEVDEAQASSLVFSFPRDIELVPEPVVVEDE